MAGRPAPQRSRPSPRSRAGYRTRVLAWLNLSSIGLVDTRVGELVAGPYVDLGRAIETAREHPDLVIGFKARLSTYAAGAGVHRILDPLLAAAAATGLPVMVHIGDTDERLAAIVGRLRPGDVVTHALTGRKHGILVGDRLDPAILEAQKRGVIFDAARGSNHLSFPVLETAAEAGFLPDTLSTDMNLRTLGIPGFGQLTLGTYLLSVGVALPEVVERMTVRPAAVLGLEIGRGFAASADAAGVDTVEVGDAAESPILATSRSSASSMARSRSPTSTAGRAPSQQRLEPWATVRAGQFDSRGRRMTDRPRGPCSGGARAACSRDASRSSRIRRAASVEPSRRRCSTPALGSSSMAVIP